MKRQQPPKHVPPARLFRLLLRSPRASLPIAIPIAGAPPGAFRVRALHPLDEAEAIDLHASAPEPLRPTLVAAEWTALALHDGDTRVFADGEELLRLFTERDAVALMRETIEALDVVSPSFRRIDEEAWLRALAEGAQLGANAEQALALALCVEPSPKSGVRGGVPRPEQYFGVPAGHLTDGQRLVFRAARRAIFDEENR